MLLNYFKIAFRTLLKFKGYAFINLFGLALGLTTGILIMIYILDEISYDKFHTKLDRIYRVETLFTAAKSTPDESGLPTNGWPIGNVLRKDYPEVESVWYTRGASNLLINYEGKHIRERAQYSSPEFFDFFSFPLLEGNASKALTDPYSIVITKAMERKYFGGQSALNKTLIMNDTMQFIVTGVLETMPSNSHIQLDMLVSFSTYTTVVNPEFDYNDGWGQINMTNYVLLKEGANVDNFKAKARGIYTERAGEMLKNWGVEASVLFTPMEKVYLTSKANNIGPLSSIDRIYMMAGIAVFVIMLACINFVNLATARSVYRAKEVGLRKVAGSTRQGLIRQFLSESFVLTILALVIAIALTGLFLPSFNQLLNKNYEILTLTNASIVSGTVILVLIVSLLAGYYPAMVMSALRPAEVLKGKIQSSARGIQLRRTLVVFQFIISATLVVGTLIVLDQLKFMQQQDLGFDKDEIFVINAGRARSKNSEAFATLKKELEALTVVGSVSRANSLPGTPGWRGQVSYPEGKTGDDAVSVEYMAVDEHYLPTLGLQLIIGDNFDIAHQVELEEGLILNEAAVAAYGWLSPEEAMGKKIVSPSGTPEGTVIGVVKNYHQMGLQQKIESMVMDYNPQQSNMYAIRYKAADTQHLIASVQNLWKKTFPGYDFNYFFLDQDFEKQYQAEQRLANVFSLFAVVTILIAAIGLIGLVSFMVVSKTKEVGVRKVLGASVFSITKLLSKEFIVLVIVANVLAIPIAWYFATNWLQQFAYRTQLNPMLFVWTTLIAIGITLLAVSYQTIRAAMADPVKSLRYE